MQKYKTVVFDFDVGRARRRDTGARRASTHCRHVGGVA